MIKIVSVVRDKTMYDRCVASNPNISGCELHPLDNTSENLPITVRYNRFIDTLDSTPCWVVFCHEDWRADAPLSPLIESLDKSLLYGPIGVFVEERRTVDVLLLMGCVSQKTKDGRRSMLVRGKDPQGRVDTFDCQCLIVHSSLIEKYNLRFDENLTFDMYVEDFCAAAHRDFGIESMVIDIPCTHFSPGVLSPRFYAALEYVRKKYAGSDKRYCTTVGRLNFFGGHNPSKRAFKWHRTPWRLIRYFLAR